MAYRAPDRVRISPALLRGGGPALAGFLTANLRELIASAVASARGPKTAAVELAEALRLHADDPALARAAAEIGEFAEPSRVAGTGLIDAFAALAARGMAAEADRDVRLSTLERLADWCWQTTSTAAAAGVRELIVAEHRADGGPELLHALRALVQETAFDRKSTRDLTPIAGEMLDLSERLAAEGREAAHLVRANRSAIKACQHLQGPRAALAVSARFADLTLAWTSSDDATTIPLVAEVIDEHIARLLALDLLDEAIEYSRRLVDRYLPHAVAGRVDPGDAAIVVDRHAHLLDRAERPEEALAVSQRAIVIGAKAEDFPRLAGLLRFHSDRLLAVGRRSEAIEVAVRAVETGERADSPLETAFSLADLTVKLIEADRDEEAFGWSRRTLQAWGELFNEGVEIAAANLADAMMNRRILMHRRGDGHEAMMSAISAAAMYQYAVENVGDASVRPRLGECLLAVCADAADAAEERQLETHAFKAVAVYEKLRTESPGRFGAELAMALDMHARALQNAGRPHDALAPALRNLAVCEEQAVGGDLADRRALAGAVSDLARLLVVTGDVDAGLEHSARAMSLFAELVAADPVAHAQAGRLVLHRHASLLSEAGRFDEALVHVRCTLAECAELVAEDRVRNLPLLAEAQDYEAHHLHVAGRVEEAVAAADEALRNWREAAELNPAVRHATAGAVAWHAELRAELGDPVTAAVLAEEADLRAAALE